jgi:hypothetical protein
MPTWDILTTTIPHRHDTLLLLLAELDRQIKGNDGVGVILYRDNLEVPYGDKTQALIEASEADYVSSIDDDDMIAPGFVEKVMNALFLDEPDYVGFRVRWTQHGVPCRPVVHSLAYNCWQDHGHQLERDITQFNPVRRELALLGKWEGGWEAERRWSTQLRETGKVKTETFIDEELYYYQERPGSSFQAQRSPMGYMPELPAYPWLRQIGPYA